MRHLKIATRLNLGFAAIIAIFLVLVLIGASEIRKVSQAKERMALGSELLDLAEKWQADVRQNSARSLAVGYSDGTAMLDFFKESMTETSRQTTVTQKAFLAKVEDAQARQLAENVVEVRKGWLAARDEVNAVKAKGDTDGARALVQSKFVPVTDTYIKALQGLVDNLVESARRNAAEVDAMIQQLYVTGSVMLAIAVVLAAVVSRNLSRTLSQGLNEAVATAQRIGDGNLSQPVRVDSRNEIGQLLQALAHMQGNLSGVVAKVRTGSESVATASSEIAQGNHDLSARTESQASALEETAASMEQLSSTVKQNADNARQANQLAQ
ncbi:MAG TPA: HAMP domain-containing protein, partial [Aquabacterium sp.]|nr:HAMP domain-containing protein [Aquabacterium sp.]